MSVLVSGRNITNIPSTHTYRYDGNNTVFNIGILNDTINLVFITSNGVTMNPANEPATDPLNAN